ncbi:MAG: hypothetical protein ACI39W_07690 [Brotaphodocola sp.]
MRHNSSFRQGQKKDEERKKLLKAAVIPLAVVILTIVIVVADRDKDVKTNADENPAVSVEMTQEQVDDAQTDASDGQETVEYPEGEETESEKEDLETDEETDAEMVAETDEVVLQKDRVPELLSLMKEYYQARATGDAELLNRLYGIEGLSVTALEAEKTRMRSNSKYLRSFDNIVTYALDGLNEDEWLVYSTCDMHFHSVDTAAPMIMWCYVVRQEDGTLLIQKPEELSPEVLHYVDVISRSQAVRSLASDINVRLKDALIADEDLNEVYGVLRDGSPVYQGRNEEEAGGVQVLDEETEAESEN